jgi:hypothetical protein
MKHEKGRYFTYDPMYGDFDTYATEEEQMNAAEEIVDNYLDDRNEWNDGVTSVVCGIITHRATECDKKLRPENLDEGYDEEGQYWPDDTEYICNYRMEKISEGQIGEQE